MKITTENLIPVKKKTEMLCGFVLESTDDILGFNKINSNIKDSVKQSLKDNQGEIGKITVFPTNNQIPAKRILLAGIGKKEKLTNDTFRFVAGKIAQKASELKLKEFSIIVPPDPVIDCALSTSQIIEGCKLSLYKFDKFKSKKDNSKPDLSMLISKPNKISKSIKNSEIISDSIIFTKNIANLPPNECNPATLALFAKEIARDKKMNCTIFSKDELKKKGFGGIYAVGKGSKNEPKLIVLEHKRGSANQKPILLVGKGVTFDTGGISLKPGEKMDEMKFDKCGGCTVLGIMKAVSELKLPLNVVGIIPAVENMPGGESYRPGDIIKLFSGKTAEILNTDAEGRLILADALSFGEKQYSPKAVIDFATLTGACIIALGNNVAAMVSNNERLKQKIVESSKITTEEVWELPLNEDYMDMIKSENADIKNIGIGKAAGTITAAAFLRNAIKETPWVHIDIAGVAWTQAASKSKPYNPNGATGFGVRLILDYLQRI